MTKVIPEKSNYKLQLSAELIVRRIYPRFHVSLLRAYEPNDDALFPSHKSKHFYDFGMPDNEEWLVDEIVGHKFTGKSIEFNIRWTAGDHTWELYQTVMDLEALDQYYALMGMTQWQSLANRANDSKVVLSAPHGCTQKTIWTH